MISASGLSKRWARTISSFSASPKWRALKRPVLGSTRASASSCGTASERWIRRTGATANGISHGFACQKVATTTPSAARTSSVDRPWNEKSPDSRIECPWPSRSIGASIAWFRPTRTIEQATPAIAKRRSTFGIRPSAWRITVNDPPRRDGRDHVVADVEELAIPGRPVLQPGRDVLDDRHHDHQLGREQQDRRDQEDVRRVVRLVARRLDERDLRQRGARRRRARRRATSDAVAAPSGACRGRAGRPGPPDRDR